MQLRYTQNVVPDLPAEIVAPFLEPDQKQVWERVPKIKVAANLNSGVVNPADLAWWDEVPRRQRRRMPTCRLPDLAVHLESSIGFELLRWL